MVSQTCTPSDPPRTFPLWWLSLLLLHGVAAGFFSFGAYFYWQLEGTYFDDCLQYYGIGMATKWYKTIALLQALVAIPHGLEILRMFGASLFHRSLAFTFSSQRQQQPTQSLRTPKTKPTSHKKVNPGVPSASVVSSGYYGYVGLAAHWKLPYPVCAMKCYYFFFARDGLFGIEGRYFHLILFCRELVETSLQTIQAYRMSFYLPRVWLNRFFVSLLVLNCWLTPLIHHVYKRHEAKKRLLCLICDCVLDLVASVVIPCAIIVTYEDAYDRKLGGFDIMLWYDDVWFIHVIREFQMLLVVSWQDLATRLVFSLGMLSAMIDIKDLLVVSAFSARRLTAIAPNAAVLDGPAIEDVRVTGLRLSSMQKRLRTASVVFTSPRVRRYVTRCVHFAVVLWGAIILGLHVYAETQPTLSECLLQVRPWGRSRPACSLVLLNCFASDITGAQDEIEAQWSILDQDMVIRILVRHCEALVMPPILQQFPRLASLKMYNSTILQWTGGAALTDTHHPNLASLFMIRVNFSDGNLPAGLLSTNFPAKLTDIEFCVTNLHTLPPDLDARWPTWATVYFEYSEMRSIPDALLRLQPVYLSVCGSPINELPAALFEVESIEFLHVGDNMGLVRLPSNVTTISSTLHYLYLGNTQVDYFPSWIDPLVMFALHHTYRSIYTSGTPYCDALDSIYNETISEFPATEVYSNGTSTATGDASVLMNTSKSNHNLILESVSCNPDFGVPLYPINYEDQKSGLPS
uniref:Uncharacterized protein n=1 Tax=Globisporangium ultimum (strain ATCC 200006 / CBS 805.95 / DAOM BR144) TaxID=431595 RepID=K3WCV7_GLOUD